MNGRSGMVSPSRKCNWKNQKLFGLATGDQWKKEPKKNLIFFGIEKRHSKKEKSKFFIGYSESEFHALSFKKIISSLAHREVPQICVGSAARNTFAARKTLAAHCIHSTGWVEIFKLCTCHFYCTSTVGHKMQFHVQTVTIKILRKKYYLQPRYNLHNYHIGLVVCFNFWYHMYCNCNAGHRYIYPEAVKSKDDFQNYLFYKVTHVYTGAITAKKTFKTSYENSRFLNKMKYCIPIQYSWRGMYNQNFQKSAGTKIEISPLKNMIETSSFFHCTLICKMNIWEKRNLENFNRF